MSMNQSRHRYRRPSVSRTQLIVLIVIVVAGLVLASQFLEHHSDLIGLIAILGGAVLVAAVAWLDGD